MSHHTSNSLKAYCCDRTISPANGLMSLLVSCFSSQDFDTAVLPLSSPFSLSLSLSLSLSSSAPRWWSFHRLVVLGEAIERVAERDMAASEKYPFAKAVSFGRASRRHCVARRRRRLRTLSPLGLGLFYLRASPTARETHPLSSSI